MAPHKNAPLPHGLPLPSLSTVTSLVNSPTDTASESLPQGNHSPDALGQVQELLLRYPAYGLEREDKEDGEAQSKLAPDLRCRSCDALFVSLRDYNEHYLSRFCPGSAAIAYLMVVDESKSGGYKIEKKVVHFNGRKSKFECHKCEGVFENERDLESHQDNHSIDGAACLHCSKLFSNQYELDNHYVWHDDMEFLHHRDDCRAQSAGGQEQRPTIERINLRIDILPKVSALYKLGVRRIKYPGAFDNYITRQNGHIVAMSLISAEDLERVHAPDGVFQESSDYYLNVPEGVDHQKVREALLEFDGNMLVISHGPRKFSAEQDEIFDQIQNGESHSPESAVSPLSVREGKRPKLRSFFSRTKPDSDSFRSHRRRLSKSSSTSSSPTTQRDANSMSDLLSGVHISASKGSVEALKLQNDRLLLMSSNRPISKKKGGSEPGVRPVAFQAQGLPGGVLIIDVTGRRRWISADLLAAINDGIQDSPQTAVARARSSALCQRANISTERGELPDAAWSWQQVLQLFRENPTIDPDGGFQLVVSHELAQIYEKMGKLADAEASWMSAIERSQIRFGRNNVNNFMFMDHIANLYKKRGRLEDASALYKMSSAGRIKLCGLENEAVLMSQYVLGDVSMQLGDIETAKQVYELGLPGFEKVHGESHEMTLKILGNLLNLYGQLHLSDETRELSAKTIPRTLSVNGSDHSLTRAAVTAYIQTTNNFDFPDELDSILQHYHHSESKESLAVLEILGQNYQSKGLLRSGSEIFQFIYEVRAIRLGNTHQETLDALLSLCTCLEMMDVFDRAIQCLTTFLQSLSCIPKAQAHPSEPPIAQPSDQAIKERLASQRQQQARLNQEWREWSLDEAGSCHAPGCTNTTTSRCSICHIPRYCSSAHAKLTRSTHSSGCIPSITLAGSRSVTIAPPGPKGHWPIISRLSRSSFVRASLPPDVKPTVNASYGLEFTPENFTTFRLKLSSSMNTAILFSLDADIRYAITTTQPFHWITPPEQDYTLVMKNADMETYLLVTPGEKLREEIVKKRRGLRSADCPKEMEVPDENLIEYCQGLLPTSERKGLMWIAEWAV